MSRTGKLIATAIAVVATTAIAAPVASAASGSISGTMTEFGTSTAIAGGFACAEEITEEEGGCGETDPEGNYIISGLEAGEYKLQFYAAEQNYVTQYYSGKATWEEAEVIELGVGEHLTGKDAQMMVGGRIEGRVTDAGSHAGIAEVEVCAVAEDERFECELTDSSGDYEVAGLATGSYVVYFFAEGGYTSQIYNGVESPSDATKVGVTAGAAHEHVDAALSLGASLLGRVTAAKTGAPIKNILVCALEAATGEFYECALTGTDGSYKIPGLPNGAYRVSFNEGPSEFVNSAFQAQYWQAKPTLTEATVLGLVAPETRIGIDAKLLLPGETFEVAPGTTELPPPTMGRKVGKPLRCKKGFQKKRARGKARCVKKPKHRHKRRRD